MKSESKGYILTFLAYFIWGALPLYWQLLKIIPSFELLSLRIVYSFISLLVLCIIIKRREVIQLIKNKNSLLRIFITAVMLCINWLVFLVSVNNGMVVECSLGYYMNPLVSVIFGVVFLKEEAGRSKIISLLLAATGVLYLTFNYGKFPFVALSLALSFGLYGLLKKINGFDSLNSLLIEIAFMMPLALLYITYIVNNDSAVFIGAGWLVNVILIFSGIVTVVPLYMYAYGVNTIPLGSVGFIQFITPTMMFLIGVFVNHEPFTTAHLISFIFIWLAVLNYCYSLLRDRRKKIEVL